MAGDAEQPFPQPNGPPGDWDDNDSLHGSSLDPDSHHAETMISMGTPAEQARYCGWCSAVNLPDADRCYDCGMVFEGLEGVRPIQGENAVPTIDGQNVIAGRYRLLYALGELDGINRFAAVLEEDGRKVACTLHVAKGDDPPEGFSAPDITDPVSPSSDTRADTLNYENIAESAVGRLHLEHEALLSSLADSLPKVIELFRQGEYLVLVLLARGRQPLSYAWQRSAEDDPRRAQWLRQLHDFFRALHVHNWILPTLRPSDVWIDASGQVVVRDISRFVMLPARSHKHFAFNHSSPPEISSGRPPINRAADVFTFGAVVCSLCLGRELRNEDFLYRGVPRKLHELLPYTTPALSRLIGRTFVAHPDNRALFGNVDENETAIMGAHQSAAVVTVSDLIAEYEREIHCGSLDVAGWSSTGLVRNNNEDAFGVIHLPVTTYGQRTEAVAVALADGMGGHQSGEVASALAVGRVLEHLAKSGLVAASIEGNLGPFQQRTFCRDVVLDAVRAANWRVNQASQDDPSRQGMGCTLEVLLVVNRTAYLCHVGDSRIYHRRRGALLRLTRDQTVVETMRQLGEITAEEAERHPRRSELSQALGVAGELDLTVKSVELAAGDWLVLCSDGLNVYVRDPEIDEVLAHAASAEAASRALVNMALARGGADNCTVVTVRAY